VELRVEPTISREAEERVNKAEEIIDREPQQKQKLATYLRSLGINPDEI
jgi:hypothetical protein